MEHQKVITFHGSLPQANQKATIMEGCQRQSSKHVVKKQNTVLHLTKGIVNLSTD